MNIDTIRKQRDDVLAAIEPLRQLDKQKSVNNSFTPVVRKPTLINGGIEPYEGVWSDAQRTHLIKRVLFGVRKSDLEFFNSMNMDEMVDFLLADSAAPAPPINDYNDEEFIDPSVPYGETWVNAGFLEDPNGTSKRVISLKSWMINNRLNQERNIQEKMLLFWFNHIPTQVWDVFIPHFSYKYIETLRANALGDFKQLIREATLDESMLIYLNGTFNDKSAPDENYARELQELFCIGKGPEANFTEADVQMAAKILTGWRLDWSGNYNTIFAEWGHDTSDKQFSEFYNNRLIEGRSGQAGAEELDELLDMIFDNNEVALFIVRKIYTFFVYNEIDANTEVNVIGPLAEMFRSNGYQIKPVLECLFKSAHFYDIQTIGAMIKSPIDFLIGTFRSFNVSFPSNIDIGEALDIKSSILWNMTGMGMEVLDPPSVSGWPAYYQAPSWDKSWITTESIVDRAIATDSLIYWGFWTPDFLLNINILDYVKTLDDPSDPNLIIDSISLLNFGIDISTDGKTQLKSILLSGQLEDYYWSNAWIDYISDPEDEEKKMIVENRLKWLLQPMLQLAENQLM